MPNLIILRLHPVDGPTFRIFLTELTINVYDLLFGDPVTDEEAAANARRMIEEIKAVNPESEIIRPFQGIIDGIESHNK